MVNKEVNNSYPITCEGVAASERPPLRDLPVQASITVFNDGSREVGCIHLRSGQCQAGFSNLARCVHLFPEQIQPINPTEAVQADQANREAKLISLPGISPEEPFEHFRDKQGRIRFRKHALPLPGRGYEIDTLHLSARARNALLHVGIASIEELKWVRDVGHLAEIQSIGKKTLREIEQKLEALS